MARSRQKTSTKSSREPNDQHGEQVDDPDNDPGKGGKKPKTVEEDACDPDVGNQDEGED